MTDRNNEHDPAQPSSVFFTDDAPETAPVVPVEAVPEAPLLPLSDHRSHMTKLGIAFTVMALLFTLVGILLEGVFYRIDPDLIYAWWFNWFLSIVPLYGVALPVMLLLLRRVTTAPHNRTAYVRGVPTEKTPINFGHWLLLFITCIGSMYVGSFISTGMMNALSALTGNDYADRLQSMTLDAPLWLVTLCTAVAAPIGEEFMFRKLLIDRTRRYGDVTAILLSATFFALFHRNIFQFFYTFFIGAVLAYAYTRTGKYWICVSLHAGCNIIGGVWPKAILDQLGSEALDPEANVMDLIIDKPFAMMQYILEGLLAYAASIAAIVLVIYYARKLLLSRGTQGLTKSDTAGVTVLNAGTILFAAVCVALTVLSLI